VIAMRYLGLEILLSFILFLIIMVILSGFIMYVCTTSDVCIYAPGVIKLILQIMFIIYLGLLAYAIIVMVVVLYDR